MKISLKSGDMYVETNNNKVLTQNNTLCNVNIYTINQ